MSADTPQGRTRGRGRPRWRWAAAAGVLVVTLIVGVSIGDARGSARTDDAVAAAQQAERARIVKLADEACTSVIGHYPGKPEDLKGLRYVEQFDAVMGCREALVGDRDYCHMFKEPRELWVARVMVGWIRSKGRDSTGGMDCPDASPSAPPSTGSPTPQVRST